MGPPQRPLDGAAGRGMQTKGTPSRPPPNGGNERGLVAQTPSARAHVSAWLPPAAPSEAPRSVIEGVRKSALGPTAPPVGDGVPP